LKQGRVYLPKAVIPPGQQSNHFVVVLTNNGILNRLQQSGGFILVALIRNAISNRGNQVKLIPIHSVPVTRADLSFLSHDSIIETHQLFHLPLQELTGTRGKALGDLPDQILATVLVGAKKLLN
jgi:PemK-like, MazF-like toxin of type II toxin-antitoxin system